MGKRGPPKGTRVGGRIAGQKNKATIEKEIIAAQTIIDGAKKRGAPELAKDVLERMMKLAEGATGLNRPTSQRELLAGAQSNPDGDWDRFGAWYDRTVFCAKELAKFQSPTFRAVMVSQAPGGMAQEARTIEMQATGTDGADRLQKASQSYLMLVKGGKG